MDQPSNFYLEPLSSAQFKQVLGRDDAQQARSAFSAIANRPADRFYKSGQLGITDDELIVLARKAHQADAVSRPEDFFLENFTACQIMANDGSCDGLLTGFYEPEAEASPVRTDTFKVPLLSRPADLVDVEDHAGNNLPAQCRFARRTSQGAFEPYYDRAEIQAGALAGQGLELVWLRDAVEAFFIHIQGAALLHLTDGSKMRVTYAAKSGHPFTAIGKALIDAGQLSAATISMQTIKAWLYDHPDQALAWMQKNKSYIFFKKMPFEEADSGPIAAAKIPLIPHRSIAVDRTIHTFGTPFFVSAAAINGARFGHLMMAHDTGSAIVGPIRADLYFGTGLNAGQQAGGVKAKGQMTVLVPNSAVERILDRHGRRRR